MIVSYGYHGGGKAAVQLRQILDGLRMSATNIMPILTISKEMQAETGQIKDPIAAFEPYTVLISQAAAELAMLLQGAART